MRCFTWCVMAVMGWSSCALAQGTAGDQDGAIQRVIGLALDNLYRADCGGRPCAPTTAEEKAAPPLTTAEARLVFQRGVISGSAEHCGLDWQKLNFLPMMSYFRNAQKSPDRKMALVGLVHGIAQGMSKPMAEKRGACTDTDRQQIEARLSFRA